MIRGRVNILEFQKIMKIKNSNILMKSIKNQKIFIYEDL
ncbi:hypothetical protein CNEO3_350004 [Clostridium neonatale]|nr:hypothetical protein CNEO3_350004 [Clostridium neonatale]